MPHVEQEREGGPTLVPAEGSGEDPFQSPNQGDAVGILRLSYCAVFKPHLGTKIVSSLYSWFSKITHDKHSLHSEQPQSLE